MFVIKYNTNVRITVSYFFYVYVGIIKKYEGSYKIRLKQSVCKNVFLCCKMLHINPQYQKNNAKCITTHIIIDAM